jgi:hypothetical protein
MHNLGLLNQSLYDSLIGKANNAIFWNRAIGTVLYLGKSHSEELTVGGVRTYTLDHKFRWKVVTHNSIMRPDGSSFEEPVDNAGSGNKIYQLANLGSLFGN